MLGQKVVQLSVKRRVDVFARRVERDHAPYLVAEKGPLGMAALDAIVRTFDPDGIMNPGVLLSDRHA